MAKEETACNAVRRVLRRSEEIDVNRVGTSFPRIENAHAEVPGPQDFSGTYAAAGNRLFRIRTVNV
ncbi:hypothetical protein [Sulfitobacter alexandrii]|uniref:hypothetical protein n=1 Tax=Sulfitobacter alexandrii TaxID=1917485 RepID=UPI00155FEDB0|nr:hypothetical protein [Sulfitobacter alexandrii]